MSVAIPIPITKLEIAAELPSRTYKLDFENKRIFSRGSCNGIEAVNQFMKKSLCTPRFRCLAYSNQRGSEIEQTLIAADVTREYIEAERPRMVRETWLVDSRILDVYDFSFRFEDDKIYIRAGVSTTFGEVTVEEVI
ncbi:MAG: DUF2634 domain-containing protein [Oscillospiraceae bacterium]|jgi:hypothetical protein|nr:DUF2634 domain-containing protein [Oscillospiraceae bacterium]